VPTGREHRTNTFFRRSAADENLLKNVDSQQRPPPHDRVTHEQFVMRHHHDVKRRQVTEFAENF
jgi:hypothetical protein